MIPRAYIDEWRSIAPWQQDFQVEQDLIISRALIQIFSHELLREHPAFRGGTALHKLFLDSRHVIRRKWTWYIYITPKQSHRISIRFQSFGFSDPEGWEIKPLIIKCEFTTPAINLVSALLRNENEIS